MPLDAQVSSDRSDAGRQLPDVEATPNEGTTEPQERAVAPVWLQRLSLFVLVLFCVYLGVLVTILPWWSSVWDHNGFIQSRPALAAVLHTGAMRGLISGLGAAGYMDWDLGGGSLPRPSGIDCWSERACLLYEKQILRFAQDDNFLWARNESQRCRERAPDPLLAAPLAYENAEFLNSADGRMLRIMGEYQEPMARFRRERIQDTVVFFGSARFRALDVARHELELLDNTGSATLAPPDEQPASRDEIESGVVSGQKLLLAGAAIEMSAYYEDARTLAGLVSKEVGDRELPGRRHRFVVTSGGGPGIMEAANRGAYEAGAKTVGLNIKLPFEQQPNPYITPALNFDFHYFFMRKYWFGLSGQGTGGCFPGGFGTLDEMFELRDAGMQTRKLAKKITVVIYGSSYWNSVINLDVLAEKGAIAMKDRELFKFADTPEEAFAILKAGLE